MEHERIPNKRVQRTRHKVSGPLTRDVRRKPRKGTRMKPGRMVSWVGGLTGYVVILCTAQAQTPDIVEFQGGGNLVWTNSNTNLYYQIQWAPSLSGTNPWMSSYRTLTDIRSSSAMVTNPVPMFYRVVGSSNVASRVSKTGQTTSFRTGMTGTTRLASHQRVRDLRTMEMGRSSIIRPGLCGLSTQIWPERTTHGMPPSTTAMIWSTETMTTGDFPT